MSYLSALRRQTGLSKPARLIGINPFDSVQSKVKPIEKNIEVEAPKTLGSEPMGSTQKQFNSGDAMQQEQRPMQTNTIEHDPVLPQSKSPLSEQGELIKKQLTQSSINTANNTDVDLPLPSEPSMTKPIDEFHEQVLTPVDPIGARSVSSQTINDPEPRDKKQRAKAGINVVREIHVHQEISSLTNSNLSKQDSVKQSNNNLLSQEISDSSSEKNAKIMHIFNEAKQWVNEGYTEVEVTAPNDIAEHDWIESPSTQDHHQQTSARSVKFSSKTDSPQVSHDPVVQDFNLSIGNINIDIEAPATSVETRQPAREKSVTPKTPFLNWQRHYMGFN